MVFINNIKLIFDCDNTVEIKKEIFNIIKIVKSMFTLLLNTLSSLLNIDLYLCPKELKTNSLEYL